jgi:AcrR family transcriptional regulator
MYSDTSSIETDSSVFTPYPQPVAEQPEKTEGRIPGRPLDPEADSAILKAATEAFLESGFQRMTIPRVAEDAGVAKTTVYRRYGTQVELALAVISHLNAYDPQLDSGSVRDDLVTLLELVRQRFDLSVTGTLLVEEREHPELLDAAREMMIAPAVERFRRMLRLGVERGELRADLDLDNAAHAILGTFFTRYFEFGRPGTGWAEGVIDTLWPAFAPQAS